MRRPQEAKSSKLEKQATMRRPQGAKSSKFEKQAAVRYTVGSEDVWSKFYLIERSSLGRQVAWDPWPVKNFRENDLFKATKHVIDVRNALSLGNSLNKIVLLPASGSVAGIIGGTGNMELYSLRSPSILPRRIHFWRTPGGKIMVWKGAESKTLTEYLKGFDAPSKLGSGKYLHFWKSLSASEEIPKQIIIPESMKREIDVPKQFQEELYLRWRVATIFPFLNLPAELRNVIFGLAMGRIAEPYESVYRPKDHLPLFKPNMSLSLVNKQLHGESMKILFSKLTFSFRHHGQLLRFFKGISKVSYHEVKSVELKFDHETILDIFGAHIKTWNGGKGSTAWSYFMDSPGRDPLNLRHIRICFPHPGQHRYCPNLRNLCQRTFCDYALIEMHPYIKRIPRIELDGCIKDDQKAKWLDILKMGTEIVLTGDVANRYELQQTLAYDTPSVVSFGQL